MSRTRCLAGSRKNSSSGPGPITGKPFTRDYFFELNKYLLEEYHVDGFRYDYVPGMYDGPAGQGYADLVYRTYQHSTTVPRFQAAGGRSRIIQCAEHLPGCGRHPQGDPLELRVAERAARPCP